MSNAQSLVSTARDHGLYRYPDKTTGPNEMLFAGQIDTRTTYNHNFFNKKAMLSQGTTARYEGHLYRKLAPNPRAT